MDDLTEFVNGAILLPEDHLDDFTSALICTYGVYDP
jgi:hypothetical protein